MDLISLSQSLINEIQGMRYDIKSGKISNIQYAAQLTGIAQIEKQQKLILQTTIIQEKIKRPIGGRYKKLKDAQTEKIKCKNQQNKKITRSECLDFSGESGNYEKCCDCPEFKYTRDLLIPEN